VPIDQSRGRSLPAFSFFKGVYDKMIQISKTIVGVVLGMTVVFAEQSFAAEDPLWGVLKKGGYVILMRNSAVDEGLGDPKGYKVEDCTTQLNLTDKGRAEAKKIGEEFKKRKIPIKQVLTSQFCRAKETAELAFGKPDVWEALNSFYDKPMRKSEQTRLLHQRLENPPKDGKNLVLVTHGYNITSATGLNPDPGDMLIIEHAFRVGFRVVGELSAKK
jgi:Histidine phosphatase superfamily (branch 1)